MRLLAACFAPAGAGSSITTTHAFTQLPCLYDTIAGLHSDDPEILYYGGEHLGEPQKIMVARLPAAWLLSGCALCAVEGGLGLWLAASA